MSNLPFPNQERNTTPPAVTVALLADLRALLPGQAGAALVGGGSVVSDGGGGVFFWNATDSRADNGTTIIAPTSSQGQGRWNLDAGQTGVFAGDVTGTAGANLIAKIQGRPLGVSGSGRQYLRTTSDNLSVEYGSIGPADFPNLIGDVVGPLTATVASGLGTGLSTVNMHATSLTWDASKTPAIGIAQHGSGAGNALSIIGQAAFGGSGAAGGGLTYQTGAGDGAGAPGVHLFKAGAANLGTAVLSGSHWIWTLDSGLTGGYRVFASTGTQFVQLASTGAAGGYGIYLDSGVQFLRDNTAATVVTWALNSTGATSATIAAGVTGFTLGWAAAAAGGSLTTIAGQAAAGTNNSGGGLTINSGLRTDGGGNTSLSGDVLVQQGGVTAMAFTSARVATVWTPNIKVFVGAMAFDSSVANPFFGQNALVGTGANVGQTLSIKAQPGQQQTGGSANNNGGDLVLAGGPRGTGGGGAAGSHGGTHIQVNSVDAIVAAWSASNANALGFFNTTPATRSTVSGVLAGAPTLAQLTAVVQQLVAALGDKVNGIGLVHDTTT